MADILNDINLNRYPLKSNDQLFAFDASDVLVVEYINANDYKNILIIEDRFGAISLCANVDKKSILSDSFVSQKALEINAKNNGLTIPFRAREISDLKDLEQIDLVIFKIPKNMSYFEEIISRLSREVSVDTPIVCPVMIKHLPKSVFEILENNFGETWTSLAKKKARLIFSKLQKRSSLEIYDSTFYVEEIKNELVNHSNVFSRLKFDIGSRFFLKHLPKTEGKVLDLGCGNGIIGITCKLQNPSSEVHFVDESWMAIRSAKFNYEKIIKLDDFSFTWTNCFENEKEDEFDVVLCNPPFHQQNTVGDFIAWQMFNDSYRTLKKGGLLRIIGNSHLGYHVKLQKIFGNSKIIATNDKFVIIDSYK